MHFYGAPQQGFKVGQGSEHVHGIHLAEELLDGRLTQHQIGHLGGLALGFGCAAQTYHYIRMGLVDQVGLGFGPANGLKQRQVGADLEGPVAPGRPRRPDPQPFQQPDGQHLQAASQPD